MEKSINWTLELDDHLKELIFLEYHKSEIARVMNISFYHISKRIKELSLTVKHGSITWTNERTKTLIRLRKQGLENLEIARKMGITLGSVLFKISHLKLDSRMNLVKENEINLIIELIQQGKNTEQIAKETNRPTRTIESIFHKHNLKTKQAERNKKTLELRQKGLQHCPNCDKTKSLVFFSNRQIFCIDCAHQRTIKKNINITLDDFLKKKLVTSKRRAEKRGFEFNLSIDFLKELLILQNNKCFYTNDEMLFHNWDSNQMSIDRVNSSKGYTKNNVVLCCLYVNESKVDMTQEKFFDMCNKIVENRNKH